MIISGPEQALLPWEQPPPSISEAVECKGEHPNGHRLLRWLGVIEKAMEGW